MHQYKIYIPDSISATTLKLGEFIAHNVKAD